MGKDMQLGGAVDAGPRSWVQTERRAHEAWGVLTLSSPRAAAVMHRLVAMMGHQNAVVISQATLAKVVGLNVRTVQRALDDLVNNHWIQIVQIGSTGSVNAYVVNSAVAWGEKRDNMRLSPFHAVVVASATEQPAGIDHPPELRRIPFIYPGERQLPTGDGLPPPSQPSFPGMEPDLPTLHQETNQ
jgi:hypothetical protein